MQELYKDINAPYIPEMIPTLLKDCEGQPISPITSMLTLYDGEDLFYEKFIKMEGVITDIFGDGQNVEIDWNTMQEYIEWLLDSYNLTPVLVEETLTPVLQRDHRQHYMKYNPMVTEPSGVRINLETGEIERLGAATNCTVDDFSERILPWAEIRECILSPDGTVDNTLTDKISGFKMIEIPLFYYKRVPIKKENNGLVIWEDWITYTPYDGFYVHPAFIRDNGTIRRKIYISPVDTFNVAGIDSKTASGWDVLDIFQYSMIKMLNIISYASFDNARNMNIFGYENIINNDDLFINRIDIDRNSIHIKDYLDEDNIIGINGKVSHQNMSLFISDENIDFIYISLQKVFNHNSNNKLYRLCYMP